MAKNSIENTVTFSGSDITVVAYRGPRPFAKLQLEKEQRNLAQESNHLTTQANTTKKDIEKSSFLLGAANADLQRQLENNRDFPGGSITPGSGGIDPFHGSGGAYQNYKNLETENSNLNEKLNSLKAQREALDYKINDNSERLSKISSSTFFTLGSIHTISYSSFREKMAVRTLGRSRAKAYSRGPRTVAGTMVFNLFQEHEFLKLASELSGDGVRHPDAVMLDQIDPFNIMLVFANEYGAKSVMHLFNIDISSEGQEMSVDSIITHNTMNFYATDLIPLTSIGNTYNSYSDMLANVPQRDGDESTSSRGQYKKNVIDIAADLNDEKFLGMLAGSRGLF